MRRSCVVVVLAAWSVGVGSYDDVPQVTVAQGALRGHYLTSRKGRQFVGFQGVPYAKPPLGELRFRNPEPPHSWSGVREATRYAPICIQRSIFAKQVDITGSEDCLYLNVFTPEVDPDGKLDVMVWFHGGGFVSGAGSFYGPEHLLDEDIVLVTVNYRLGPIGFLSTGDAVAPGNFGLKDQVAALRWVHDNIEVFGGNSDSVTLFGESAGGSSVHYHMLSPLSRDNYWHTNSLQASV